MAEKVNVYQIVTDKIIEQLKQGIIPWHKPWGGLGAEEGGAISYTSRRPYSLLNQFLLEEPGEYISYKQAEALGGKVKRGSHAKMVVYFSWVEGKFKKVNKETGKEEEVVEKYPLLRYYNVFHIRDIEGIESKLPPADQTEDEVKDRNEVIPAAEKVVHEYFAREAASGLKLVQDKLSARAYYSPSEDLVKVPMLGQFEVSEAFYGTLFHEMVHSTGCDKRLKRSGFNEGFFGNAAYAKEELVAEIGSAMLASSIGIDTQREFNNSVAYIESWMQNLKKDNHLIVTAAARAEKAVKYILTGEKEGVSIAA